MQHGANSMNKRGAILDIVLHPLFVLVIGVGIVLPTLLGAINNIGDSVVYETKFFSADIALNLESLFAVSKDVNVQFTYPFPPQFSVGLHPQRITVYADEGRDFFFTGDSFYTYEEKVIPRDIGGMLFYKIGNTVGIEGKHTNPSPNLNIPYCENTPRQKSRMTFDHRAVLGRQPATFVTGGARIDAQLRPGAPLIKLYINSDAEELACVLSQQLAAKLGTPTTIIPVNTGLLASTDPRSMLALPQSIFIEVHGLPDTAATRSSFLQAVKEGVNV